MLDKLRRWWGVIGIHFFTWKLRANRRMAVLVMRFGMFLVQWANRRLPGDDQVFLPPLRRIVDRNRYHIPR